MSAADKIRDEHVEVQVERLFAGREPSAVALARCPTLQAWRLRIDRIGFRRWLVIHGTLVSERFTVKDQPPVPTRVLWMDRRWRFAMTDLGLWNLGEREKVDE
jgi:hypothetical protein